MRSKYKGHKCCKKHLSWEARTSIPSMTRQKKENIAAIRCNKFLGKVTQLSLVPRLRGNIYPSDVCVCVCVCVCVSPAPVLPLFPSLLFARFSTYHAGLYSQYFDLTSLFTCNVQSVKSPAASAPEPASAVSSGSCLPRLRQAVGKRSPSVDLGHPSSTSCTGISGLLSGPLLADLLSGVAEKGKLRRSSSGQSYKSVDKTTE